MGLGFTAANLLFQSTPPARGATNTYNGQDTNEMISIHAPREGGDVKNDYPNAFIKISIHAPREGGDR